MAGIATRIPWNPRNLTYGYQEFNFPAQPDSGVSDMEFEFLEDGDQQLGFPGNCNADDHNEIGGGGGDDDDQEEQKENDGCGSFENNKSYWESQHQVLQATLCRTSSLESRIRNATKEAMKVVQSPETAAACACGKSMAESCKNCLMREVSSRLQKAGFNSAICRSKWRSSPNIPSGNTQIQAVIYAATREHY